MYAPITQTLQHARTHARNEPRQRTNGAQIQCHSLSAAMSSPAIVLVNYWTPPTRRQNAQPARSERLLSDTNGAFEKIMIIADSGGCCSLPLIHSRRAHTSSSINNRLPAFLVGVELRRRWVSFAVGRVSRPTHRCLSCKWINWWRIGVVCDCVRGSGQCCRLS